MKVYASDPLKDSEGEIVGMEDTGEIVQVSFNVQSVALEEKEVDVFKAVLGTHFTKLFELKKVLKEVLDEKKLLHKIMEDSTFSLKIDQKKGSFVISPGMLETLEQSKIIKLETRTFNKGAFLSKVNSLPEDVLKAAKLPLENFLEQTMSAVPKVANKPAESK